MNKILVRAPNWLGDAVMSTAAIKALRDHYPEARIDLLGSPGSAPVFMSFPYIDKLHIFRKEGLGSILRLARVLRRERYDAAILLQNAIEAAILARLAGIGQLYGYRTDGRRLLLSASVPADAQARSLHHAEYYVHMLRGLGLCAADACADRLVLHADAGIRRAGLRLVDQPAVVVCPGAAFGGAKRWNAEGFAYVARSLYKARGLQIVLCGGPDDAEATQAVADRLDVPCLDLAGRTDIPELMGLIANADLVLSNDSGPMHIAAALQRPLVAIFGATRHEITGPVSPRAQVMRVPGIPCAPCMQRECTKPGHYCMDAIDADEVYWACVQVMESCES